MEVKLFSGKQSVYLAEKIADYYGYNLGVSKLHVFSDGEMQPEIHESVRGGWVFFIQSTFSPADNLLELLLLIDTAKRASAGYNHRRHSIFWICETRSKRQTSSSYFR